jgi:hypothetical protein
MKVVNTNEYKIINKKKETIIKAENKAWSPMPPKAKAQSQRTAAQRPCHRSTKLKQEKII